MVYVLTIKYLCKAEACDRTGTDTYIPFYLNNNLNNPDEGWQKIIDTNIKIRFQGLLIA